MAKNDIEAVSWYQKPADLGSMKARNMLALYYPQEIGNLPLYKIKVLHLLNDSAYWGYSVAQNNLRLLYSNNTNKLPIDNKKAYPWFAVAFTNGVKSANVAIDKLASEFLPEEL